MKLTQRTSAIVALAAGVLLGGIARGQTPTTRPATSTRIISENFDEVADDAMPAGGRPVGTLIKWEGVDFGVLGKVGASSAQHSGKAGKSLQFTDASPQPNKAPNLMVKWPATVGGVVRLEWKFLVVSPDLFSVTFVGGNWPDAAMIFIIEGGRFTVQYGNKEQRAVVAKSFQSGKWYSVRCDVHQDRRTFDFGLDEEMLLRDYPVQTGHKSLGQLFINGDFSPVDRRNEPVLYLDDLSIASAPTTENLP